MSEQIGENPIIQAVIPKDAFVAIWQAFAGKADTKSKFFEGPFQIDLECIRGLNDAVARKLCNHSIEGVAATVVIANSDKSIREFSTWKHFSSHPWNGAEETEEVTVRWEFLVSLPGAESPLKHVLLVRIGRQQRPGEVFRFLVGRDGDEDFPDALLFCAMFCRVDFVNPVLGQELMNLVSEWHTGLKRPLTVPRWAKWLVRKHEGIQYTIEYSVPMFVCLACLGFLQQVLLKWSGDSPVTVDALYAFGVWASLSVIVVFVARFVGSWLAHRAEKTLAKLSPHGPRFQLTNGDANRSAKELAKSDKAVRRFFYISGWTIAINLVCSFIAFKLGW